MKTASSPVALRAEGPWPRRVIVLGSTGSIGTSALKVARARPESVQIVGLAAHSRTDELAAQAAEFGVKHVAVVQPQAAEKARTQMPDGTQIFSGEAGLVDLIEAVEADVVLVAIVGTGGLRPALKAIERGYALAVASKEILVMAGQIVMGAAKARGVPVLPVDSEHNAIFQCLEGHRGGGAEVSRLILTASGGPFRQTPAAALHDVTVAQALKHPTWQMGQKITIDSATLFNKGLEMIEARWLFDIEMERVDVVVHPQSVVHSMVEFVDGSVLAQLSHTDMVFPIQYALTWPRRQPGTLKPLDFATLGSLTFEPPRIDDFPALRLARQAGTIGFTMPAAFNAANEVAVEAFLAGQISFPSIWKIVEETLEDHQDYEDPELEHIIQADAFARAYARQRVKAIY
jgi:1-deoxy-D-xylulose-5-phosphate reductoisomerase